MKYPRQHKIYTGHLDLGSVACLFFLLLTFVLLKSSFVFTPGLRVALNADDPALARSVIRLREGGQVIYQEKTTPLAEFEAAMRAEPKRSETNKPTYTVEIGMNVKDEHLTRVRALAEELKLNMRFVKPEIELPLVGGLAGTTNETVVVVVAQNEQLFFDNQVTRFERLAAQLKAEKAKAKGPLTLVIEADQDVRYAVVMRLSLLAREAGFSEVLLGGRPKVDPISTSFF